MSAQEWFETQLMIAAENARRGGFVQTHNALLDVLRAARDSTAVSERTMPLKPPRQTETVAMRAH